MVDFLPFCGVPFWAHGLDQFSCVYILPNNDNPIILHDTDDWSSNSSNSVTAMVSFRKLPVLDPAGSFVATSADIIVVAAVILIASITDFVFLIDLIDR